MGKYGFKPANSHIQNRQKNIMMAIQKRLIGIALTTVLILLIPLIAMQFTNEVNWSMFDFMVAGILLLVAGLMLAFVIRKVKKIKYRIAICLAILTIFLLIWAELAVGLFNSPLSGN